jgi:hypothetical protein
MLPIRTNTSEPYKPWATFRSGGTIEIESRRANHSFLRKFSRNHNANLACSVKVFDGEDVRVVPHEVHSETCNHAQTRLEKLKLERKQTMQPSKV